MNDDTRYVLQLLETSLPFTLVAVVGSTVRALRFGMGSLRQFVAGLVCSAFVGFLAYLSLRDSGLGLGSMMALSGSAGYSGGAILDAMQGRLLDFVRGGTFSGDAAAASSPDDASVADSAPGTDPSSDGDE